MGYRRINLAWEHFHRRSMRRESTRAVSFVELLVVIAAIGVMVAIAVPLLSNVAPTAKGHTAQRNLNYLNAAVFNFNQSNWELVFTASGGTGDEQAIYNSLRYRDATNPAPGSPYLPDNVILNLTSDDTTYRAHWTGRLFELLEPGESGSGIDLLNLMGTATGAAVTNTPVPPQ